MIKSTPLISIVTPSFNQGQFIEQTINSVLNQTYKNIEYIIVDGGSTDNTMEIVNTYKDRIDIIISEKDKGQSDAINKGFKLAKGELVGWINSDDILYNDCVSEIVELYTKQNDGAIYYSDTLDFIDINSKLIKQINLPIPNREYLLCMNYSVIQQGSFYSNKLLKQCDFLNEKIHYCMDLDLWFRLLEFGNIYSVSGKSLSAFRIWEDTKTSTGGLSFLKEIRLTLLKHGGGYFSRNMRRIYWYTLKQYIKKLIK